MDNRVSLLWLFIVICMIAVVLLVANYLLSPKGNNSPDIDKLSPFECGFSSFNQTRSPFHIHFYLLGLLFLIFDLEIALLYPYVVSSYNNGSYGLVGIIIFLGILAKGFIYEIGKGALKLK